MKTPHQNNAISILWICLEVNPNALDQRVRCNINKKRFLFIPFFLDKSYWTVTIEMIWVRHVTWHSPIIVMNIYNWDGTETETKRGDLKGTSDWKKIPQMKLINAPAFGVGLGVDSLDDLMRLNFWYSYRYILVLKSKILKKVVLLSNPLRYRGPLLMPDYQSMKQKKISFEIPIQGKWAVKNLLIPGIFF